MVSFVVICAVFALAFPRTKSLSTINTHVSNVANYVNGRSAFYVSDLSADKISRRTPKNYLVLFDGPSIRFRVALCNKYPDGCLIGRPFFRPTDG